MSAEDQAAKVAERDDYEKWAAKEAKAQARKESLVNPRRK